MKCRKTKIYILCMVLLFSFLLSGCLVSSATEGDADGTQGESAPVEYRCISNPKSEKKIYVILKNYHGDYWEKVIKGVEKAAKEVDTAIYLGGIDNETDISGQIRLMNEAIEQGADGILLAPANSNSLVESCAKAKKKNVSVVLIDSAINSTEFDMCYMTDNIDAGKMAAKEMIKLLQDAGNSPTRPLEVGILLSSDTSQAMVNRVSGFLEAWTQYAPSQWDIAKDIFFNGGDVKKAQTDASALLEKNKNIKGLYGCNNTSTIGIAKTLVKEKRTDIVMVGFDMAKETQQFIQDTDYQGVSLLQKQDQMGYLGIHSLASLINGEKSEQKFFDTGVIMVNSYYLMEKGVS
nr:ABC transporter substrate-binding protein [uncultured Anaerobutyricum sp.]